MNTELQTKQFTVEIDFQPESGKIITETWRNQFGKLDRLGDLPAFIDYCPEHGTPIVERWHNGEGQHRTGDKPSVIATNSQTKVRQFEAFVEMDRYHRDDNKPAFITRAEEGAVTQERFYRHGKLHREPKLGPALILYNPQTSKIIKKEFWIDGTKIHAPSNKPRLDI